MNVINVNNVSLNYPIYESASFSLKNRLLTAATGGLISKQNNISVVTALQNISFKINDGDRVGLIGHNGAGKSSLLKVLAGIYLPTTGNLSVIGKVVSTLNLSIGIEPEATGLENIFTRGLLLGMTKKEITDKLDDIIDFTDLGAYIHLPVKIYSTGMLTRLAFGVVTAMDADILLMDEVIGTGDAAFIEKAEKRLNQFINCSKVLVLASHSEFMIRKFCNKAIVLKHGNLIGFGDVDSMFEFYNLGN